MIDGLYSISHIQNYFEYMPRKHWEKTVNPVIKIYVNKIENKITFKIKTGYYLKILTLEAAKLFGSTKSNIYFYSWRDKLIVLWTLNRQAKIFLRNHNRFK